MFAGAVFDDFGADEVLAVFAADAGEFAVGAVAVGNANAAAMGFDDDKAHEREQGLTPARAVKFTAKILRVISCMAGSWLRHLSPALSPIEAESRDSGEVFAGGHCGQRGLTVVLTYVNLLQYWKSNITGPQPELVRWKSFLIR